MMLLVLTAEAARAKDIYGFMTGNGNTAALPIGMYKFDTGGSAGEMTSLQSLQFMFWGGAYAQGKYYMLLSDDYAGYSPEGLCTFDFSANKASVGQMYQPYGCADMTYDYSSSTMYGVMSMNGGEKTTSTLIKIDLATGEKSKVAPLDQEVKAIACTYFGDLYAMTAEAELCRVDKTNGRLSPVGSTGLTTDQTEAQSMEFDRATDELYWTGLDGAKKAFIIRLNTTDGSVAERHDMTQNSLIVGLHIPFKVAADDAPAHPADLKVEAGKGGVALSWTNPAQTFAGAALASIDKVEILRNGVSVHTVEAAKAGEKMTWTDDRLDGVTGTVRYTVYAYNAAGRGEGASATVFLGEDTPLSVSSLNLQKSGATAVLVWKAPEAGKNGGTIDASKLTYKVTRLPDEKTFDGIKETSFTDQTLSDAGYYSYQVTCYNSAGTSDAVSTDTAALGPDVVPPYTADLQTVVGQAQWLVTDGNKDGTTWTKNMKDGTFLYFTSFSSAANDSLVSVPFSLKKGVAYEVRYTISAPSLFGSSEDFSLSLLGNGSAKVLDELGKYSNKTPETRSVRFTVSEDGAYNFAMAVTSAADQNSVTISSFAVDIPAEHDLAVVSADGDDALALGKGVKYAVVVANNGASEESGYTVSVTDDQNRELAAVPVTATLAPGAKDTVNVELSPSSTDVRYLTISVQGKEADHTPEDNVLKKTVSVIAADEKYAEVGGKESSPYLMPFSFEGSKYSYSQTVYRKNELNAAAGQIKEIQYLYNNTGEAVKDRHVKVFLGNSEGTATTLNWTDEGDLTQVFDGRLSFDAGSNLLRITFDTPFEYTGNGLCVMCQKVDDDTSAPIRFSATNTGMARTLIFNDAASEFDASKIEQSTMLNYARFVIREGGATGVETVTGNDGNGFDLIGSAVVLRGGEAERISLFTADGRLAASADHASSLSVTNLIPGVYIVKVVKDGQLSTGKLLVK